MQPPLVKAPLGEQQRTEIECCLMMSRVDRENPSKMVFGLGEALASQA